MRMCVFVAYIYILICNTHLQGLMRSGKFNEAAGVYFNGKNNVRNTGIPRTLASFSIRNLSNEGPQSWAGKYYSYFGSLEYLKDMIE